MNLQVHKKLNMANTFTRMNNLCFIRARTLKIYALYTYAHSKYTHCTHTFTYTYARTHSLTHIHLCTYALSNTHCVLESVYVLPHRHEFTRMHIYKHTHKHIQIHTNTQLKKVLTAVRDK